MKQFGLKDKILFAFFAIFLIASGILFNFEQMILAVVSFSVALLFAILLAICNQNHRGGV